MYVILKYVCSNTGPCAIDVTYDTMQIPNSPFRVNATPGNDASRVKAYGPGTISHLFTIMSLLGMFKNKNQSRIDFENIYDNCFFRSY